ncbi:hypothetical protein A3C20_04405 [Candidatus Kaiserbacteria bacterium RIFCSPHIGHO2_02_FULL_55_25]|uniref:Transposase IS200-like domain-containing protein n=1 Tax=Candidatus Kaiserbacteria bacterium RIFCSPHIGHO2_02_FULL_55_25 TaxID=1798498 RepID=A0A1F6EAN3_9BACT|nr:MAG: hypothetical protein A2764_03810 [Candidatus Kaiserbacteria bacterium RIFCSPHIGHO2_01_FULL_55_79]OGG70735.1 MAG: hypothetical protein A3C20_04405 [Candidatus Kaiserbacteria bacterium RIFCSPHIGHO2_02_FULL_55_25]OGG77099.1 MAG: hypothetical protein A3F56_03065 [Candidatus Kaiserbacteria bacterium RIFCSPHIGHO2_12_FULL_55_13]OGG84038.1 MAG: hypothetical protein A3A42_03245 [Candidatus Kaiserbacteria bacterium RIFCSPLOWO2_01_FULL_55_25]
MDIVRSDNDRWRFLKLVRYLNDANVPRNWERDIGPEHVRRGFARPEHWPHPKPYVSILGYCLLDNHFHFLFQEIEEGGISRFMQRLCTSMSAYFNAQYAEAGTLFQGSFQARTVDSDRQLQYLNAYIHVKNPLEKYPGGLSRATEEFEDAFEWARHYEFAGLIGTSSGLFSALLDQKNADEVLLKGREFKEFSRDVLLGRRAPSDWHILAIDE